MVNTNVIWIDRKLGVYEIAGNLKEIFVAKIIGGTAVGVAGAVALPIALPLLGFTSAGVAAGSIAASVQSAVYGAWTGGLFAAAQERFQLM